MPKILKTEPLSGEQNPCVISGTFVQIHHLNISGLEESPSRIYVRDDAVSLWKCLSSGKRETFVFGPPGVGKSTIVWAWAVHTASKGIRAHWIHLSRSRATHVTICGNEATNYLGGANSNDIKNFVAQCGDGVLIVDGLRGNMDLTRNSAEYFKWGMANSDRRLIFVSSESIKYVSVHYKVCVS